MSIETLLEDIKNAPPEHAVEIAQTAAQQLTDAEHQRFRSWNYAEETKRRESEAAKHAGQAELIHQLRESGTIDAPVAEADSHDGFTAWTSPGTDTTAMPLRGDRFQHDGKVWESLVDFNSWEPKPEAHAAWQDITALLFPPSEGEALAYTDSQHYTVGQRVEYDGTIYECILDHFAAPGWTPVNAHANWQRVE